MAYELKMKDPLTGYVLNDETDEIICVVGTKRPDKEFNSLKELIEKSNNYDDLCK